MKKMKQTLLVPALLISSSLSAFAQSGAREDSSMLLVYLFLGTCGLIIFLQLFPVFAMVCGILKGIFGKKVEQVKPAPVKTR